MLWGICVLRSTMQLVVSAATDTKFVCEAAHEPSSQSCRLALALHAAAHS